MSRTNDKGMPQTNRSNCYFCNSEGPIETHHIIPKRFDGSDNKRNLVDLCPTCHVRLERLYDDRVFVMLGASDRDKKFEMVMHDLSEQIRDIEMGLTHDLLALANEISDEYTNEEFEDIEISTNIDVVDVIDSATSKEQLDRIQSIKELIESLEDVTPDGAPIENVIEGAKELDMGEELAEHEIQKLKKMGEIYSPEIDHLRTT